MKIVKYESLSEALDHLRSKGYKYSFRMKDQLLECLESRKLFKADDLRIVEYHRFQTNDNPPDISVIIAVNTNSGEKGTIVSKNGPFTNIELFSFLDKVKIQDKPIENTGRQQAA